MLQESGRLALSDAWDQDQFEMPQWEKLPTRLFFLELMAKMPYTMECFFPISSRSLCWAPAFHAAESPFELSECKPQIIHIRFRLWQFCKLGFFAFKTQPKTPECFLHFVSRFEILHTRWCQGSQSWRCIQALRHRWCWMLHPCSWPRKTWIFGRFFWWFWMKVWVKLLSLGCEYTKMLYKITRPTRHFNCQYQLSVKILCMFCWSRF